MDLRQIRTFVTVAEQGSVSRAASLLHIRRLPGVHRPGIAAVIPTKRGPSVLIDAGANADARPEHLLQFGHMGAVLSEEILGVVGPEIRLLSIGEEPEKGSQLVLEAHELLRGSSLRFAGNTEGRTLLEGEADVVVADRLAPRELLGELPADVELVDVAKLPRGRSAQQEEINRIIVDRATAGKRVVRFKGGDSFVFGRGFEEVEACRAAGVPVTVVPGLTSPISVPALAGIPVTHRGVAHDFTVISGHLPPGHPESLVQWGALASLRGTIVLMMAVENAPLIAEVLLRGGRDARTPVAVVCDGTMPTERTVLSTLGELADDLATHEVHPPAVIVVGEVVAVAHPDRYPG